MRLPHVDDQEGRFSVLAGELLHGGQHRLHQRPRPTRGEDGPGRGPILRIDLRPLSTTSGYRRTSSRPTGPPPLVPNTATGASPTVVTRPAPSSACCWIEVCVHRFSAGLRELPRRS
jgi:hypothetical protein